MITAVANATMKEGDAPGWDARGTVGDGAGRSRMIAVGSSRRLTDQTAGPSTACGRQPDWEGWHQDEPFQATVTS